MKSSMKYMTVAALTTALAACGGGSSGDSTGTMSLGLTDAPVDELFEVNIKVTSVEVKPADGQSVTIELEAPEVIDLLQFQDGTVASLFEDQDFAAGEYEWIRLHISDDPSELNAVDSEGQHTLFIPSGAQTGLKLVSGFTIPAGGSASFTIDFDVRKSIVNPQGSNPNGAKYFLKPALRLIDNVEAGTISGTVSSSLVADSCENSSLFDGAVYVYSGADQTPDDLGSDNEPLVVAPVKENGDYAYTAAFLAEGQYTISYTCDLDEVEDENGDPVDENLMFVGTQNVLVEANSTTEANF